jgi:hypothetical protein
MGLNPSQQVCNPNVDWSPGNLPQGNLPPFPPGNLPPFFSMDGVAAARKQNNGMGKIIKSASRVND